MWETRAVTRPWLCLVLVACGAGTRGPNPTPDYDVSDQPHGATTPEPAEPPAEPGPGEPQPTPAPAPASAPAPAVPAGPDAATLARLSWPPETQSYELKRPAHVFAEPDEKTEPLGKVIDGTRLPVGASLDGDKRCKVWLAAAPRGWICARHAKPSKLAPVAIAQPPVPEGEMLPQPYFGIKEGAARYATEDDVRAGLAAPEPKEKSTYMVTKLEEDPIDIDGTRYWKTSVGLVATTDLYKEKASTFAGVDLVANPPPAWPFAWVIADDKKSVTARATPEKKGVAAGTFAHRQIVPVLEEGTGFVRVGDGQWIARKNVRIARERPRPAVDDAPVKWIDLDRDEQVMIAYEGEKPVFATLVSSGRRKKDTPPALYRLRSKSSLTKMAAEEREASHYLVSEVPWATRFRSGLYFHAAYWHDGFGTPRSHGCVNLSPKDARWVYDWTEPVMPTGWNELEIDLAGSMVVRVFDAKHPDPPVFDYAKEAIQRAKIRKQEAEMKKAREEAEAAARAEATGTVTTADPAAPAPAAPTTPAPAPAPTTP
jgi:lipoprotein-anchoring transpeptidase ErfK/SrfK